MSSDTDTPWRQNRAQLGKHAQHASYDDWDWRALVPQTVWNQICLDDARGWDEVVTDEGPSAPFVLLSCRGGTTNSSHDVRVAWDAVAQSLFYSRDWTTNGLPFVEAGEQYLAGFWFQALTDAKRFHERYGGAASWNDDFAERRDALRRQLRPDHDEEDGLPKGRYEVQSPRLRRR